jgi:hypothetical protein
MRGVCWLQMTAEQLPKHCIRVTEAAHISGWSQRTVFRHLPFIKTYRVKRPGTKRACLLIDYASFRAYLEQFAEGPRT